MDALTLHIHSRLRRRGFNPETASVEFVRITSASDARLSNASNEFWYLNSKQVPGDLVIESPLHSFNTNDAITYSQANDARHHEFGGGQIEITTAGAVNLEFIRVIPEEILQHN